MTRTWLQQWQQASRSKEEARRARAAAIKLVGLALLSAGLVYVYGRSSGSLPDRNETDTARAAVFAALSVVVGLGVARNAARALHPHLRALEPGTAGAAEFVIRIGCLAATAAVALRILGVTPRTLATAGAITAVVVGLAAQQTMGNLFAGMILFSARPYRIGDQIRLQAGPLAGTLEGRVSSLGLMYTVFEHDGDQTLIPNATLLACAVTPLRSPAAVEFTARLRPGVLPSQVQNLLHSGITVALRDPPEVQLEALEEDVVVRIFAAPAREDDGPQLADEVLRAIRRVTQADEEIDTEEFQVIVGEVAEVAEERAETPPLLGLS